MPPLAKCSARDACTCTLALTCAALALTLGSNISQEGRDDIDDLRELGEINGLKLSSNGFSTVTAYQLSQKGLKTLAHVTEVGTGVVRLCCPLTRTQAMKKEVDELIHDKDHPGELVQVFYHEKEKEFYLKRCAAVTSIWVDRF